MYKAGCGLLSWTASRQPSHNICAKLHHIAGLTSAMYLQGSHEEVQNPDPHSGLYIATRTGKVVKASIPPGNIGFQVLTPECLLAVLHCCSCMVIHSYCEPSLVLVLQLVVQVDNVLYWCCSVLDLYYALSLSHFHAQVGESMQVHSGGLLRATPHYVRSAQGHAGVSRNTFAVFMQPDVTAPMDPPPGGFTKQRN